jgi:hypothetical protein
MLETPFPGASCPFPVLRVSVEQSDLDQGVISLCRSARRLPVHPTYRTPSIASLTAGWRRELLVRHCLSIGASSLTSPARDDGQSEDFTIAPDDANYLQELAWKDRNREIKNNKPAK